jgi:phage terminase small subunit
LEFIAKDIGGKLIPFLSKEEMLKHITPEERLIGLTPEERRKLKQLLEEEDKKNQR